MATGGGQGARATSCLLSAGSSTHVPLCDKPGLVPDVLQVRTQKDMTVYGRTLSTRKGAYLALNITETAGIIWIRIKRGKSPKRPVGLRSIDQDPV